MIENPLFAPPGRNADLDPTPSKRFAGIPFFFSFYRSSRVVRGNGKNGKLFKYAQPGSSRSKIVKFPTLHAVLPLCVSFSAITRFEGGHGGFTSVRTRPDKPDKSFFSFLPPPPPFSDITARGDKVRNYVIRGTIRCKCASLFFVR